MIFIFGALIDYATRETESPSLSRISYRMFYVRKKMKRILSLTMTLQYALIKNKVNVDYVFELIYFK